MKIRFFQSLMNKLNDFSDFCRIIKSKIALSIQKVRGSEISL